MVLGFRRNRSENQENSKGALSVRIDIPLDLAQRLYNAARTLGRKPEECALDAIRTFVIDCEDAATLRSQLGGSADYVVRIQDYGID
jgi:hypothetical protein